MANVCLDGRVKMMRIYMLFPCEKKTLRGVFGSTFARHAKRHAKFFYIKNISATTFYIFKNIIIKILSTMAVHSEYDIPLTQIQFHNCSNMKDIVVNSVQYETIPF